mgnify:CR=1 FL=1
MNSDNPAARLLKILTAGKEIAGTTNCRNTWLKLLDVDNSDPALLMFRLGKVMELPNQIIKSIRDEYTSQSTTHKHWSEKVNTAFMEQNLNSSWSVFIQHIDTHTLNYLSMSAELLDMKSSVKLMPQSDLADMRAKADELLKEAIDIDINPDFKKYIVHYLKKIINSIDEYNISGVSPILGAMESAYGHAVIDETYRDNISDTDFGGKFAAYLNTIASAVTVVVGLPQLPESFQFLLAASKS